MRSRNARSADYFIHIFEFYEFCATMEVFFLLTSEILDNGGVLYQDDRFHKLGADSVILSKEVRLKNNCRVCDLGAGQGFISLFLMMRNPTISVCGIEIMEGAAEIARKNADANGFNGNFSVKTGDMREIGTEFYGKFDIAVSNPPYFKPRSGKQRESDAISRARCETDCSITELCQTASRLVKWGGLFYAVYRAERLCDITHAMRECRIEPKTLKFIARDPSAEPTLFVISGKKGAASGIKILPPVFTGDRCDLR